MTKSLRGRGDAAPFFDPSNEHPKSVGRSANHASRDAFSHVAKRHARKNRGGFVDGIVGGERVLIATPRKEKEKGVEIRIRVALATKGVVVMKHTVESCWCCGKKPKKQTGLGKGMTDLVCLIPEIARVFFVEVKKPGYSPSDVDPMQRTRMAALRRWGFVAGIATSEAEALDLLAETRRQA